MMNAKKLVTLTLMVLTVTQTVYVSLCEHPYILRSSWLVNPVYLDGDITDAKEWIDAESVELDLGTNYGRSPPFLETKLWAKNDLNNLYLLYRIEFPYGSYDLDDQAFIYYLIYNGTSGFIATDKSIIGQLGSPQDQYDYDGSIWTNDVPTGINNVEGMGHYDGTFYWFELKKPLDSGDMCDWLFEIGETYGYASSPIDKSDHLCVGLYDDSQDYNIQNFIQLVIAKPSIANFTPVGGELAPTQKAEIIRMLLFRLTIYLTVILCCIISVKKLI
ncbi:hypothetical protein DRO31_07545 [Candidatus Bathyarchaeota archaeon]|nr:MAG: hypothetical protein DRO31_07545 [Candidatus Bathyarchaeota archaeon]